jgi:hypothetical protein
LQTPVEEGDHGGRQAIESGGWEPRRTSAGLRKR